MRRKGQRKEVVWFERIAEVIEAEREAVFFQSLIRIGQHPCRFWRGICFVSSDACPTASADPGTEQIWFYIREGQPSRFINPPSLEKISQLRVSIQ